MSVELSRRALIGGGLAVAGGLLLPVGTEPLDNVSLSGMRYIGTHILTFNPRHFARFPHAATVVAKDAIDA